jgi:glycosyltransferase involved in cell wall biosynthesis
MRILHAIHWLNPSDGGPPMVCTRLAAAQALLGHEVGIVAYSTPGRDAEIESALRKLPGGARVCLHTLPPAGRGEFLLAMTARRTLPGILGSYDLVHAHHTWNMLPMVAAEHAHATGKPYCITPHGTLTDWGLQRKRLKKQAATRLLFGRMFRRARFMHVLSPYERDGILTEGLNPACEIIPNGVFLEEFDPLPATGVFRGRHQELKDDPFVLFLARLHPGKGADVLIDALPMLSERHPNLRIVLAGPDFGAEASLRAKVASLGHESRVHFVGPLWGRDKVSAYVDSSCYCLPSEHEGFSMSIVEALACARPAIITRECNFPEVAEQHAGLIVDRSARAIADAIDRLLHDPDRARDMGLRGRRLIESGYTWSRIAQRLTEAYARHSAEGPRSPT